ncbi:MAG: DNA replication complex GINS family protein [Candidatus Aenigmarchaeota archaeon]|nr:DNA replication complex GINS family protein [Candidatus Aenigmarchaeota archaeon]
MSDMITFKYLREIQKKERSSSGLCKLDDNFYGAVSEYVLRKKRIKDRGKDFSFKEKKEIENIGPVVKSIYDTRETKIVNGAVRAARTGMKMDNILPSEKRLFEDVKKKLVDEREVFDSVLCPKEGSVAEERVDEDVPDAFLKIRIVEDIPEFVGEDLKTYGPWKAGETVLCPDSFSLMFVKAGKAEDVE